MHLIFNTFAATTGGTDTNPPFEKSTSGFSFLKTFKAWKNPTKINKQSEIFFTEKPLLNFPHFIC